MKILDVEEYEISEEDVKDIAEANNSGQLTSLKEIWMEQNKTISGYMNILLAGTWPKLQVLALTECGLTKDDIKAIATARQNGFLPSIDLTVKSLSPSDHIPVVPIMCGAWGEQKELDLRQCTFSEQDVITIAEANRHGLLPSVMEIKLYTNKNTSGHIDSLLSGKWRSLQQLNLLGCNLTVGDMRALVEANRKGYLPSIQMLALSHNEALSDQLSHLFTHTWPVLQELHLELCYLTVEDIRALGEANGKGYLPSLQILDLSHNEGLSGQLNLLVIHTWPVMQELYLSDCALTPADGDALLDACKQGHLPQLKKLNIGGFIYSSTANIIPSDKIDKLEEHIEEVKSGHN